MKKYQPEIFINVWDVQVLDMVESETGTYVPAKLAEEMMKDMKLIAYSHEPLTEEGYKIWHTTMRKIALSIVIKAEAA